MTKDSDVALPKALTDFVFDLYDSVTLSQLTEEQTKLYETDFKELSAKYFGSQPWPSPQSIASECNGDPLFLAIYREMTHRHWHQVSRPNIRDRIEGWQVYRELFDEILEADDVNFFLLPGWVFDILHEFSYQFQGFCQVRSAIYASAKKHGLLGEDGTLQTSSSSPQSSLLDNITLLENSRDAWDVEVVFSYLHHFSTMGLPSSGSSSKMPPVYTYFNIFGAVTRSRVECLLADYVGSLQALTPLTVYADYVIPKDENSTVTETIQAVFPARLSLAYHAGVSLLMLRRYRDAIKMLGDICATMSRGFKTGQLRKLPGSDQFNKQFDRMVALLAILQHVCPTQGLLDDSIVRAIREKHGARIEAATSYEEWFQSPKFVSPDPNVSLYRHQVYLFVREMDSTARNRKLRSFLKLYTVLPIEKLARFHDSSVETFLPALLSYKIRMRQLERHTDEEANSSENKASTAIVTAPAGGSFKSALDIHFYVTKDTVHIEEAQKQRRFENFFFSRIEQNQDILRGVMAIDTNIY